MVSNFPISNLLILLSKLLKPLGTFFNLSISYLSTSGFPLVKSVLLPKLDKSTPAAFFKSVFVAKLDNYNSASIFFLSWVCGSGKNLFYIPIFFLLIQLLNELL